MNSGVSESPPAIRMCAQLETPHFPRIPREESRGRGFAPASRRMTRLHVAAFLLVMLCLPIAAAAQTTTAPPPASQPAPQPAPNEPYVGIEDWGDFSPGNGFLVGRSSAGELAISAYALVRYLNQMPSSDTFVDHLGNERTVDGRNDIFPHRVIIWFKGWLGRKELVYNIAVWTVNTTNQVAAVRHPRLPVQSQIHRVWRHQRQSRHALAPRITSVLARPRSRDGR